MAGRPFVLISGRDVLEGVGGHETYVRAHARALVRLGFEPHVLCFGARTATTTADFGFVHHAGPRLPAAARPPVLSRAVVRLLSGRRGPHGIHGFSIWAAAGALAARTLERRGTPAVALASAYGTRKYEVGAMQAGLHRHHRLADRLRYRAWLRWIRSVDDRWERWGYLSSSTVLVNYESVQRILHDEYGPGVRTRLVPYTSEDAFLADDGPAGGKSAEPLVLAVSRHDPRKGLDVLLKALSQVAAAGVSYRACLVGPGRLLDAHRRLCADLGMADRVSIPGRVEDVRPFLAQADVFVLPSLAEASGSVSIIEALRSQTPVVASACDGVPEDLADGEEALLVPPGDAGALAGALRRLLADPALRARLAAGGARAYERRFSAERFVEAQRSVLSDLGLLD